MRVLIKIRLGAFIYIYSMINNFFCYSFHTLTFCSLIKFCVCVASHTYLKKD